MLQEIITNIFEKKWSAFAEFQFPIKLQKIVSSFVFDNFLKQFFLAETNHYCNSILEQLSNESYLSKDIKYSEDLENIQQILFDWVQFDAEMLRTILLFAIQTEVYFIFNPVKTLIEFNFSDDVNLEVKIENLISNLDFFNDDSQNIIKNLKDELLELENTKQAIFKQDFYELCSDIYFKIVQNQNLDDFLQPLINYMALADVNELSESILSMFLSERDLHGILTQIKEYLDNNNITSLNIERLRSLLNKILNNENIKDTNSISLKLEELRNSENTPINIIQEYVKMETEHIAELIKQIKSL